MNTQIHTLARCIRYALLLSLLLSPALDARRHRHKAPRRRGRPARPAAAEPRRRPRQRRRQPEHRQRRGAHAAAGHRPEPRAGDHRAAHQDERLQERSRTSCASGHRPQDLPQARADAAAAGRDHAGRGAQGQERGPTACEQALRELTARRRNAGRRTAGLDPRAASWRSAGAVRRRSSRCAHSSADEQPRDRLALELERDAVGDHDRRDVADRLELDEAVLAQRLAALDQVDDHVGEAR